MCPRNSAIRLLDHVPFQGKLNDDLIVELYLSCSALASFLPSHFKFRTYLFDPENAQIYRA